MVVGFVDATDVAALLGTGLVLSAILQVAAALLAIRLIPRSRRRLAWVLISIGLALMAVRRLMALQQLLPGGTGTIDPASEALALAISLLIAVGVWQIWMLFAERERLEAQLRQAEKLEAIGRLAGGVAHDFNNQLLVIMSCAEELAQAQTSPELRADAQMIVGAAQRSAALTRNLLAFARKGTRPSTPVDVHRLIAEVEGLLARTIDRRIEIRKALRADAPVITGDAAQLQSMLLNLAINARDAMPEGGALTLSTAEEALGERETRLREWGLGPGRYVVLGVADTGTGFDPEARAHLFEPFFTTKAFGKGTGLGLASVYGTVRSHHGAIEVESAARTGTTFRVYLPLATGSRLPARASTAEARDGRTVGPPGGSARVLVVEDDDLIRELLAGMLRDLGHEPVTCRDGLEATAFYRRAPLDFDLVILDTIMPRLGGEDTLTALVAVNPGVRVVVCSGHGSETLTESPSRNVLGYLHKPFLRAELSDLLSRALPGPPPAP